jgi:hypothetical protein
MDAIAFEAAAALDAYEERVLRLRQARAEPALLAHAGSDLHRVCGCCIHLPQLSVGCVTLLLSHYRLMRRLAGGNGALPAADRSQALEAHQRCIAALRRSCRELLLAPRLH